LKTTILLILAPKPDGSHEMIYGFVGMIFSFFIALFGASLVIPSILIKLIKRIKGGL
jgi:hypothetical protein